MKAKVGTEDLSKVALGLAAPDILITNAMVFNVFTGEFIPGQSIWIKGEWIAYVGPDTSPLTDDKTYVIDAGGKVLLPGLIDGHAHLIGNRYGIEEFVKHVIPCGVTSVVTETIDFAMIAGRSGLDFFVRGFGGQPIRIYYTVPALTGLTPSEEVNALTRKDVLSFLKDPNCLGMGEIYWGNIFLKGRQGERVRKLVSLTLGFGKRVEGHGAGAAGKKLQAYTCFGVSSDHEPITENDVLERLRLGYWVMIREGSVRRELAEVRGIFEREIDFRRLILVTDGMDPEGLLEEGYLDDSLRRALKLGVPPGVAYQMVTLNVAEHFRLDHLIGSLSPGKAADMVMIPSPGDFRPELVMCRGRIISRGSSPAAEPRKVPFPEEMCRTVKVEGYRPFSLPEKGTVRAIELVTRLVTKEALLDLADPETTRDLLKIVAIDRLGRGKAFSGLIKGFGLQRGAYGATMNWDCVDLIAIGADNLSIETVIGRLKEIGGGGVYAIGSEVVAEFPAPLCGIASLKPMETVRDEVKRLEEALGRNGVKWERPVLTVDTLASPSIPHLRISHEGYVRFKDWKVLPVEV
jgi:adenine deaminase